MADQYLRYDTTTGFAAETEPTVVSTGAPQAGDIVALDGGGKLDVSVLPNGVGPATFTATATEALTAGDFVERHSGGVRLADNTNSRPADGYVIANVANAATATVYFGGVNNQRAGLTAGDRLFLTTAGDVTNTPPTTAGHYSQYLGRALSATEMLVEIDRPIILA